MKARTVAFGGIILPPVDSLSGEKLMAWVPMMAVLTGCKSVDEYLLSCVDAFEREWGGYADSPCDDWTPPDDG